MERAAGLNNAVNATGLLLHLEEFDYACKNNYNYAV